MAVKIFSLSFQDLQIFLQNFFVEFKYQMNHNFAYIY